MYEGTPRFFADQIRSRLRPDKDYSIVDVGAYQGELLDQLLRQLPEYKFRTVAVDIDSEKLSRNRAGSLIVSNAENLPLADSSVDIAIIRYVLAWNYFERQKNILKELARITREFTMIEHGGADSQNSDLWRAKLDDLFDGQEISKMKRKEHFFSSRDELEAVMREASLKFERIKEVNIDDLASVFSERYNLNPEELAKARKILGDKNYLQQTDWIIYPKN